MTTIIWVKKDYVEFNVSLAVSIYIFRGLFCRLILDYKVWIVCFPPQKQIF